MSVTADRFYEIDAEDGTTVQAWEDTWAETIELGGRGLPVLARLKLGPGGSAGQLANVLAEAMNRNWEARHPLLRGLGRSRSLWGLAVTDPATEAADREAWLNDVRRRLGLVTIEHGRPEPPEVPLLLPGGAARTIALLDLADEFGKQEDYELRLRGNRAAARVYAHAASMARWAAGDSERSRAQETATETDPAPPRPMGNAAEEKHSMPYAILHLRDIPISDGTLQVFIDQLNRFVDLVPHHPARSSNCMPVPGLRIMLDDDGGEAAQLADALTEAVERRRVAGTPPQGRPPAPPGPSATSAAPEPPSVADLMNDPLWWQFRSAIAVQLDRMGAHGIPVVGIGLCVSLWPWLTEVCGHPIIRLSDRPWPYRWGVIT